MPFPVTGTTERLHRHTASLKPTRTALAFFLGIALTLAAVEAASVTPMLSACALLALIVLGMLLAQQEKA